MSSNPNKAHDERLVNLSTLGAPAARERLFPTSASDFAHLAVSIAGAPSMAFSGPDISLLSGVSNTEHLLALRSLQRNQERQLLLERYLLSQQQDSMAYADIFRNVGAPTVPCNSSRLLESSLYRDIPLTQLMNPSPDPLSGLYNLPSIARTSSSSVNSLLQELLLRRSNELVSPFQDFRSLLDLQSLTASSDLRFAPPNDSPLSRLDLLGANIGGGTMHASNPPTETSSISSRLLLSQEPMESTSRTTDSVIEMQSSNIVGGNTSSLDDVPWDDIIRGGVLTSTELRGSVSDLNFAVMAQMKPCVLTYEDRVGLYKARDMGCRGMCCKHCGGVPGFGRYFPGSFSSLVNGNICKSIIKHLSEECRACPTWIRDFVTKLDRSESLVPFHCPRGSRRQFFSSIWSQIHEGRPKEGDASTNASNENSLVDTSLSQMNPSISVDDDHNICWDKILENSTVVQVSDRHLVPDTIFAATAQTKPCEITDGDRVGRCKDHRIGTMGLCCKHCEGKPGAFGRYFPSNLHTFAQVEVCKQIVKHITGKCHMCPPEIRDSILLLQEIEQSLPPKRYPSRMVFFRRVWHRFHFGNSGNETCDGNDDQQFDEQSTTVDTTDCKASDIPWEELLSKSTLVNSNDRGLISDSQFAAISQMDPCRLTADDRIGYNKDRKVGFIGMACRHCGGRPGFGRYFPNTVRNFEKTSARDTMVSHVTMFCQKCPEDIRNVMLNLKRIESSHNGSATMKGLVYGSGKLFFRRIWSRLHGNAVANDSIHEVKTPSNIRGPTFARDEPDDDSSDVELYSDDEKPHGKKRGPVSLGIFSNDEKKSRQL